MVWKMQEMKKTMDDNDIEAPMLLDGIHIKEDHEEDRKKKEWNKTKDDKLKVEQER
jgi:hypothetical protein